MNRPATIWSESAVQGELVKGFGVVLAFSLLVNVLVLTSPLYMMQIYDRVLQSGQVETLLFISLIALAALVVFGALDAVRTYLLNRLGIYIDATLRDQVLVSAVSISRKQGGATAQRLVGDLNEVRNYLGSQSVVPFLDAPWVIFFIAVMAILHPWLGILGLVSALFLLALTIANDRLTRSAIAAASQQQLAATQFSDSALAGAEVIHAMGMQQAVAARYRNLVGVMIPLMLRSGDLAGILSSASKATRIIVQSAALGLGAFLVIRAELSPGGMIAGSILLGRALAPIEQAIGAWRQFLLARASYTRLRAMLSNMPVNSRPIALPDLKGQLNLEGIFLQLPGMEKPLLRNISLAAAPGTAISLIGPSASGKSTLCRLMVGAISPSAGRVRLDGADILSIGSDDISRTIGYLPQAVDLFSGTASENIARLGTVDDAKVVAAAKAAGCHEMILRLPNGYETELGARGQFLSGGQRQRIGLARALYGDPQLLVLDEPNANLDQEGERALIEAIVAAKQRRATVVLVNHRSTLLQAIDKLGVLRDGVLERFGDRDTILREMQPSAQVKPVLVPVAEGSGVRP